MIEIKNLHKAFGGQTVLNEIDLCIDDNQCFGLIGRNGAGKTTLFRILSGLLQQDRGQVFYDGSLFNRKQSTALKRQIGLVLDESILIPELTGIEFLQLTGQLYGLNRKKIQEETAELVRVFFDREEDVVRKIATYSAGMKKRMMLCGALIHRPKYLLLDEPFAGLDVVSIGKVIEWIQDYARDNVVLLSSHNLSFIERCCQQIAILEKGEILFNGGVKEFISQGENALENHVYEMLMP